MSCNVSASPSDVTFYWSSNQSHVPEDHYMSEGTSSTLILRSKAKHEYGSISCWAQNIVGKMKEPCKFSIIPAGPPEPVSGCLVTNQTASSAVIDCVAGYDGGLQQTFHLELFNDKRESLLNESQNEKPFFLLNHLASGTNYYAIIYSTNAKGKSNYFEVKMQTRALLNRKFGISFYYYILLFLYPFIFIFYYYYILFLLLYSIIFINLSDLYLCSNRFFEAL